MYERVNKNVLNRNNNNMTIQYKIVSIIYISELRKNLELAISEYNFKFRISD